MIRICSNCCEVMGYKEGEGLTHGICPACAEAEKAKLDRAMIRKYNAGVVDMIEDLMMFDPISRRRA